VLVTAGVQEARDRIDPRLYVPAQQRTSSDQTSQTPAAAAANAAATWRTLHTTHSFTAARNRLWVVAPSM